MASLILVGGISPIAKVAHHPHPAGASLEDNAGFLLSGIHSLGAEGVTHWAKIGTKFLGGKKMNRTIREMNHDEIVTFFLRDRGADVTNEKLRSEYTPDLIERFQRGDVEALTELLQLGPRHGGTVVNEIRG